MRELARSFVRMSAFFRKEILLIVRQPQLLLALVIGPFLILLVFGLAFRNEPEQYRMLFVAREGSLLEEQIETYAETLHPQLVYMGVTNNEFRARERLRRGEVDLVAVAPEDAYEEIRNSRQAVFDLYTTAIDPFQVEWLSFFGGVFVNQANYRVLRDAAELSQQDASHVQDDIAVARVAAEGAREALMQRDLDLARQRQRALSRSMEQVSGATGASLALLNAVEQALGEGDATQTAILLAALARAQQNSRVPMGEADQNPSVADMDFEAEIARLEQVEQDLATLEEGLYEFRGIAPEVLIAPFAVRMHSVAASQPDAPRFLTPAAVALLLQHMGVSIAGLSVVRERRAGALELFRVSPLSAAEALMGKYLSYIALQAVIAAVLTLLMIYGLQVPMLGNWWHYALVVLLLVFTSLGIGFVISLVSTTDSQAVQYTMLVLLASVFFSGFFMSLEMLEAWVRVISWSLPTTYGVVLLRDIMLRGVPYQSALVTGLGGIGVALCLVAWLLMRQQMKRG